MAAKLAPQRVIQNAIPVVTRASIALFQVLPCQTGVCGGTKFCKTQESVKLYSQRRGRAKICHKQTDQPGAHINGLLCCVPAAGWEGYCAYHYCSYTKHSSAAAEHCKALQQGELLSFVFFFSVFFFFNITLMPFAV